MTKTLSLAIDTVRVKIYLELNKAKWPSISKSKRAPILKNRKHLWILIFMIVLYWLMLFGCITGAILIWVYELRMYDQFKLDFFMFILMILVTVVMVKLVRALFESLPLKYIYVSNQTIDENFSKIMVKKTLDSVFKNIKFEGAMKSASYNEKVIEDFVKYKIRRSLHANKGNSLHYIILILIPFLKVMILYFRYKRRSEAVQNRRKQEIC